MAPYVAFEDSRFKSTMRTMVAGMQSSSMSSPICFSKSSHALHPGDPSRWINVDGALIGFKGEVILLRLCSEMAAYVKFGPRDAGQYLYLVASTHTVVPSGRTLI